MAARSGQPGRTRKNAAAADEQWWEIPASFLEGRFVIRLREPAQTSVVELIGRLRSGRYSRPFVLEDDEVRRLQLGLRYAQSEMSLADPQALTLPYTQAMMAFLLFHPAPKDIVLVGLGGGSMTKFCHRRLPASRITAIEIDERVLALGALFEIPEPDARLRILHGDAVDYFSSTRRHADVVLLDGCDRHGVAPAFGRAGFYRQLRAKLRRGGVLVVNLIGNPARADAVLEIIGRVFEQRVLVLRVAHGGNRIAFAFAGPGFPPDWPALQKRAPDLQRRLGLEFVNYGAALERNHRARQRAAKASARGARP